MIVVTGGAGFIGSNLVKGLNDRGREDILVVDDLTDGTKAMNLADCMIADYLDKNDFARMLDASANFGRLDVVFHNGACSDTMEADGGYMMRTNYEYSKNLLAFCTSRKIPFIYASSASVYGNGPDFQEQPRCERPLNIYAYSKWLFDRYVRDRVFELTSQVVGLRYFNVYGPREQHKGRMASVAFHFYNQYKTQGKVSLFEGSGGFEDGDQRRDFIWVGDVVDVNLYFLDHPEVRGVFNVGTGNSQSFNDVAAAAINAHDGTQLSVKDLVDSGAVQYIPFPEALKGKYQSYTEADVSALRNVGYEKSFATVEVGVGRYIEWRNIHER